MSQFAVLPDPGQAQTLDEVTGSLRLLKTWAGNPSYETITARVNNRRLPAEQVGKTTVVDCFRTGRRRLDADLVVAVVEALHADAGYTNQWRQALRVASGETRDAADQVRVLDTLPAVPPAFTGRVAETAALLGPALLVLSGMPGVGKTALAVHAAHQLVAAQRFDRILAVNLRGSHADQPPADPGAVLDGFLRLLGTPGHALPHGLPARTAAFRTRLTGARVLVLLDDAADEAQARPLLGTVTLITSRRRLDGLAGTRHVPVDVFRPEEARDYLLAAAPSVSVGPDPSAAERIAETCGHLPLALARVAAHMRERPGWTLTDHADWLAERHRSGRIDPDVRQALDVSYRQLTARARDLLRLLALHPGVDFDAGAATALAGRETAKDLRELVADHLLLPAGEPGDLGADHLLRSAGEPADLGADHLLRPAGEPGDSVAAHLLRSAAGEPGDLGADRFLRPVGEPGGQVADHVPRPVGEPGQLVAGHGPRRADGARWRMHALVRAYAVARSADEDRRADRRAALTRLFHHLITAEASRADLAAAARYAAAEGWPVEAARLAGRLASTPARR